MYYNVRGIISLSANRNGYVIKQALGNGMKKVAKRSIFLAIAPIAYIINQIAYMYPTVVEQTY